MPKAKAAYRRYLRRFVPTMLAYVVIVLAVTWLFAHQPPEGPVKYAIAILPALPVIGIIVIMGRYLVEETDEFMRMRHAMALLVGLGMTLSVTSAWGFLENYTQVSHLDALFVFPGFCAAWGFSSGVLAWWYR